MKISDFSGGLSTRLDPSLIQPNEAVVYTNIDNGKGTLTSIKTFKPVTPEQNIERWFYKFKNKWYSSANDREYLEYNNKLIYTEKDSRPGKVNNDIVKLLGIDAPTTKLTTVENPSGSLTGPALITPPGDATDVTFSPSGDHAVVVSTVSPYITIYNISLGRLVKIDDPASIPGGAVRGVAYSQSGKYLAIALDASPYVIIYKRSGDTYVKLTDPVTLPTGQANGVAWSSDETYLSVAHAVSPYVTIYKRADDVFTKLTNPATLPTGVGKGVVFSSDTTYMAVAHTTSPYVTIYKRAADVFTKLANPASLPAGDGLSIDFSLDGTYLTIGLSASPYLCTYSRSVDTFTKLADFANAPAGAANGVSYSNNYNYLVVAHDNSPYTTFYKRVGDTFTKLTNPAILATGNGKGVAFTPNDTYVGVAHTTTPFITIFKRSGDNFAYFNESAVLQYTYTYYDSSEGTESPPAPISDELSIEDGTSVDISGFLPSGNTAVDTIRLYRLGENTTDFTLIVELPASTTTYNDDIATIDAIGTLLDTYNNQPPVLGLRYIIEAYGTIFGAKGNLLYYTLPGTPDYWPALNFIQLPADITGLAAIPDGIVIFTATKAHLLLGSSAETFRQVLFNPEHGCLNHNSIKYLKNTLLWCSADGICALSGASVNVVSKDKLDKKTLDIVAASVYNEQYHVILANGDLLTLDLRFNPCFKDTSFFNEPIYNLGAFDNVSYGVVNGKLVYFDSKDDAVLTYESPVFTDGDASVNKLYNNIYIRANGNFTVDVYIDGIKVHSEQIIGNKVFDIKPPQDKQRGSDIQFKITGTGTIKEIEYKVLGRDNGR